MKNLTLFFSQNKFFLLFLLIILFITGYLTFYNLGKTPLDNWDEAWYGAVVKHMFQTSQFIVPYWNGTVNLDKPPLFMWLGSLFSLMFGLSEFSLRLPSALSGFFIILIVTVYCYKKYGVIPALAAFSTITLNNIFIWRARSANLDALSAFLIFICYFLMISRVRHRLLYLGGLFACIYLTRASYVVFPLALFLFHELVYRWREFPKNALQYLLGTGIFLLLCGLWLYVGYKQAGSEFTRYFIYHSDRGEATVSFHNFHWDYILYTYYALQRKFFFLFILGLILLVRKVKNPEYALQILFSVVFLIFLSFTANNNNWYVIPLAPFWSLVVGYAVYEIVQFFHKNWFIVSICALGILYVSYKTFTINIVPILHTTSAIGEAQSGIYIKTHTKKDAIIARIDNLYPTFVYYSDRKVVVSPVNINFTGDYFISRSDLLVLIRKQTVTWLAGEKRDVDFFMHRYPEFTYKTTQINPAEYVVHIIFPPS